MLRFVVKNRWFMWVTMGVMVVCLISMACFESVRRKSPINFIFLFVFTACEGLMLGTLATFYSVDAVLISVGITAGVTLGKLSNLELLVRPVNITNITTY